MAKNYFNTNFPKAFTKEETEWYLKKAASGDREAIRELAIHNMRYTATVVQTLYRRKRIESGCIGFEDYVAIGIFGLMKAVETYDENKGASFYTYSRRCITNEVLMHLRVYDKHKDVDSLDRLIKIDGNDSPFFSILDQYASDCDIEADYLEKELHQYLRKSFIVLDSLELNIILLRYGFKEKVYTQKELSHIMGISQSYISRIEKTALSKMSKYLKKEGYELPKQKKYVSLKNKEKNR